MKSIKLREMEAHHSTEPHFTAKSISLNYYYVTRRMWKSRMNMAIPLWRRRKVRKSLQF